jgi:glutamate synthase (NADPH/NADH) small chain
MPQTEEMLSVDRKERMKLDKVEKPYRAPAERIQDFNEAAISYSVKEAMAEASRCIHCAKQPCVDACPLHNDMPSVLWYVEKGDFLKAAEILRETSPLPEVCGRVCPPESTCAAACVLDKRGKGIATGLIEAFVADYQRVQGEVPLPKVSPPTGQKVAVIGAGPAGLAVAEELTKAGHAVTVYDALPSGGGLLTYGIPSFKLDKSIVQWKIDWLRELDIEFVFNMRVGEDITLDSLIAQEGYDAVFLGTGAGVEATMNIPGESELGRVHKSIDFLTRANLPAELLPPAKREPLTVGKRVAVIGGGDTATDCLRTAIRLGAEDVICYYRRTEVEMPGNTDERHHAEEEGAQIIYLTAPVAFLDRSGDGSVDTMQMIKMELGEPDSSGRRRPVPIEGSEYDVEVDDVVLAIGYWPDPLMGETTDGLETEKWGLIIVDEETGQTSRPEIFAGGDNVTGPAFVNAALAAGIRAARGINAYLAEKVEANNS